MIKLNHIKYTCALIAISSGALTGAAYADVAVTQVVTIDAPGALSMMASETRSTNVISGEMSRSDSKTEMKSSMMKMFMPNTEVSNIMRLDRELLWNLDNEKQTYQEMTFADLRAQQAQMMESMSGGEGAAGIDQDSCTWSEPTLSVDHTRRGRKLLDRRAEQHILELSQSCTNQKTGAVCDMNWNVETWVADGLPGQDEVMSFHRRMAGLMGADDFGASLGGTAQGLLGMYGASWQGVAEELGKIEGYALAMTMEMSMGGAECLGGAGGSSGGNGMQAAAEIMSGLGGLFGGSKKKKQAKQAESDPASGSVVFRIDTVVTAWDSTTADSAQFEVPAGYRLTK